MFIVGLEVHEEKHVCCCFKFYVVAMKTKAALSVKHTFMIEALTGAADV